MKRAARAGGATANDGAPCVKRVTELTTPPMPPVHVAQVWQTSMHFDNWPILRAPGRYGGLPCSCFIPRPCTSSLCPHAVAITCGPWHAQLPGGEAAYTCAATATFQLRPGDLAEGNDSDAASVPENIDTSSFALCWPSSSQQQRQHQHFAHHHSSAQHPGKEQLLQQAPQPLEQGQHQRQRSLLETLAEYLADAGRPSCDARVVRPMQIGAVIWAGHGRCSKGLGSFITHLAPIPHQHSSTSAQSTAPLKFISPSHLASSRECFYVTLSVLAFSRTWKTTQQPRITLSVCGDDSTR